MRADDILPDDANEARFAGRAVRKGTIAAFLTNAKRLSDGAITEEERARLLGDIAELTPDLRAVGLFDVLAIRDAELRAFVEAQP